MEKSYGQIAYEAYFSCAGGKSLVSGQSLPSWEQQKDEIKNCWEEAAGAVIEQLDKDN